MHDVYDGLLDAEEGLKWNFKERYVIFCKKKSFLNQALAWFLKIDPVRIVGTRVCVCLCPRPRLLINSGMM